MTDAAWRVLRAANAIEDDGGDPADLSMLCERSGVESQFIPAAIKSMDEEFAMWRWDHPRRRPRPFRGLPRVVDPTEEEIVERAHEIRACQCFAILDPAIDHLAAARDRLHRRRAREAYLARIEESKEYYAVAAR